MAVGSGLGGQVGFAAESTYGTVATPTRFLRGQGDVQPVVNTQEVFGISAGLLAPTDQVITTTGGTGKFESQAWNRGLGLLLAHVTGSSTAPVQQSATTAYLQTHAATDNRGKFLTMQVGIPDVAGTARPYTGLGGKITELEVSCAIGEVAKISAGLDFRAVSEATGLAAASYVGTPAPFHFGQMSVKLGTFASEAVVQGVRSTSIKFSRPMNTDDAYYAGNAGLKSEPNTTDMLEISGTLEIDYVTKADFVDRSIANTATSMVIEWVGPIIASTFAETLRFKCPRTKFGATVPSLMDNGIMRASVPFKALTDLTNGLFISEYMSLDTTI